MQQEQEVTAGRASAQRISNACIKMIFKGFGNVLSEQWHFHSSSMLTSMLTSVNILGGKTKPAFSKNQLFFSVIDAYSAVPDTSCSGL